MRIYTGLIFALLVSCGGGSDSGSDSAADCEKAEIDLFTLAPMAGSPTTAEANVTIKDQCDDKFYRSVFALKEAVVPADCADGTQQISRSTIAFFNGLTSGKTYWVRACASLDGWQSEGASRMIVIP